MTKRVVAGFAGETATGSAKNETPALLGTKSEHDMEPSIAEALSAWDVLSGTQLEEGVDKIEQYVDLVEQDRVHSKKE